MFDSDMCLTISNIQARVFSYCHCSNHQFLSSYVGTPFLFVITGLAVRTKQYGVQEGGKLA